MGLHKIVNGVRIDLTPEEEEKTRAEWAENKIKIEARRVIREAKRIEKERVIDKLLSALTEEEKLLIKPKLM